MTDALEAPTGWHRVCLNTIVRKERELDSERLRILPMGSKVFVEEVNGRRVKISSPIVGWCSKKSSTMDTILEKILPDNTGGVTPSNRNQNYKLERLTSQANKTENQETQKKLQQEIDDLKNVMATEKKAANELADQLKTLKAQSEVQLRPGDVVQLPEGKGLGVVKFVGATKESESILVGVQVEGGMGESDGIVTLPDGSQGGWKAGELGALFYDPSKVMWLPGEKMLSKLIQLQQLVTMTPVDQNQTQKME